MPNAVFFRSRPTPRPRPVARRLTLALALLTASAIPVSGSGCRKPSNPRLENAKDYGEIVATVGARTITTTDVKAKLAEQPAFALARYRSPERKKEFVEAMIRTELLLDEARRRGLDQDPEVKAALDKVLLNKLTQVYSEEVQKKNAMPEADLHRYYDAHTAEFTTPTRVRLSHLFLACPEKDACRTPVAAQAARILDEIKRREAGGAKQGFELTASQRSEDSATKATGGDLGYKTREDLALMWGPTFADAASALSSPGQIGAVIATEKGLHLVKLLAKQDGYKTPFDAARTRIETRLSSDRRSRALDELVADLQRRAQVKVNEQALTHIDIDSPLMVPASASAR